MTKYSKLSQLGQEVIQRENPDGSLSFIPLDEANSDYQNYLESLKPTK